MDTFRQSSLLHLEPAAHLARSRLARTESAIRHRGIALPHGFSYTGYMGAQPKKHRVESKTGQVDAGLPLGPDAPVSDGHMQDGTPVILRPVRPDDRKFLCLFFGTCSPKSLYSRFERQINELPMELAEQFCSADGTREISVVAEMPHGKQQEIMGVGQLLADPNHTMAEYAVLVADPWQGKGLGSELTDFCLEVAKRWGIKKVVGEFSPSNVRIIRILQSRQFHLHRDLQEQIVFAEKILT